MQAQEFESIVQNHAVAVPRHIPEGARVKITLLPPESVPVAQRGERFKALLCRVAEGLSEADLARSKETGRDEVAWPTS